MCLQNISAGCCQKQVRDFFKDFSIPVGGVSLHRRCAFIAFDTQVDARLAVSKMDQQVFDGKVVRVSIADHNDVERTRLFDVKRQLMPECLAVVKSNCKKVKRIRPTKVKDCVGVASKKFCPDEIEFPGNVPESCLIPRNNPPCFGGANVPDKKKESCLLEGNVPGKNESYVLEGNVSVRSDYCLSDEKVSVKKSESSLLYDNIALKKNVNHLLDDVPVKNDSCLFDGNVSLNDDSCPPGEKGAVQVSEYRLPPAGNVSGKNKSCLLIGKLSGKVNDAIFQVQKTSEPVKRLPMKTIKPTPVFTLSQFKLAYEGTVF